VKRLPSAPLLASGRLRGSQKTDKDSPDRWRRRDAARRQRV